MVVSAFAKDNLAMNVFLQTNADLIVSNQQLCEQALGPLSLRLCWALRQFCSGAFLAKECLDDLSPAQHQRASLAEQPACVLPPGIRKTQAINFFPQEAI